MDVLVLGAGYSGLTTAWKLLRRGHRVRIWAKELPLETTSGVAAAIWYPFEAAPEEKVAAWALRSLESFEELAEDPRTGVRFVVCDDLADEPRSLPPWARALEPAAPRGELAKDFPHSWSLRVPVIETPTYLPWLVAEIERLGGRLEKRSIESLAETRAHRVVCQCTGLGARSLSDDEELFPIRGQVVRAARGAVERAALFERGDGSFGYVIPRGNDVVLGGTAEHGVESTVPDPEERERIVQRCSAVEKALDDVEVFETKVGLRPGRTSVRLESERRGEQWFVHNYGHGGCGVTLSHACAEDAVALVEACPEDGSA